MNLKYLFLLVLLLLPGGPILFSQSLFESGTNSDIPKVDFSGMVRGLQYIGTNNFEDINFPSSLADLELKLNAGDGIRYRGFVDLRYRIGELNKTGINEFRVREAWAAIYSPSAALILGQQVIKWGNAEFLNKVDVLNPRFDLVRSPDIEDRDLGNLLARLDINPGSIFSLQLVASPVAGMSNLYTDYINMGVVEFSDNSESSRSKLSYGAKLSVLTRLFEQNIYWYDGNNIMAALEPMGISLPSTPEDEPIIHINRAVYPNRIIGYDFSGVISNTIIKAGFSYTASKHKRSNNNSVPFNHIDWFTNMELNLGNLTAILEYSGSRNLDFTEPLVEPILPGDDLLTAIGHMTLEEVTGYTNNLVRSFNRLMNYQIDEYYHSAGLSLTYNNSSLTFSPELRLLYMFTTGELMVNPLLSYSYTDNISIIAGLEYWQGPENSLFQLVHKGVNGLYFGLELMF